MLLPHLCRVVDVDDHELPPGHDFVIAITCDGQQLVFAKRDPRAQLAARIAFLEWDAVRDSVT